MELMNNFQRARQMLQDVVDKTQEKIKKARDIQRQNIENKKSQDELIKKGALEARRIYANPDYPQTKQFVSNLIVLLDKEVREISRNAKSKDEQIFQAHASSYAADILEQLLLHPDKLIKKYNNLKKKYGEKGGEEELRFAERLERIKEEQNETAI